MSHSNDGDPIGDAPDADPELVRSGAGRRRTSVVSVLAAVTAVVLVIVLILVFV